MGNFNGKEDFRLIEEKYAPMISAIIRKLSIYRDHEEYRQIGKVALWQAWSRYDAGKGDFTPFAFRTVHGAMLDTLAREGRYAKLFLLSEGEHFEDLELQVRDEKLPEWLAAIDLRDKEKQLLHELFVEDKGIQQLAALYGISVSGMKKRKARLLEKIRESETFRNRV